MKNLYLYGASDDCHEIETDFGKDCESYGDIRINGVVAHWEYDGDWGVILSPPIPGSWKVRAIQGNCASKLRGKEYAGTFIHIQVPDDEPIIFVDLDQDD